MYTNRMLTENVFYRLKIKFAKISENQFSFDLTVEVFSESEIEISRVRALLKWVLNIYASEEL